MAARPCPDGLQGGSERFAATDSESRDAVGRVMAALRRQGWPSDFLGSVEIVLAETLNNVVEHAYRGQPSGEVAVDFTLDGRDLWLRVMDRGTPFASGVPPVGHPADVHCLPEGGFGWHLIRSLSDEIQYAHQAGANRLAIRMALPG
ncbi:MAG: ATP-binding protein [Pseudooceanicola sp.]|nr:ATP-binding protein [Pseudooceanicola sp.]